MFHVQFQSLVISFCTLTGFLIHTYFFLFFSFFFTFIIFWTQVRERGNPPKASEIQYLYGLWFNSLPRDRMKYTDARTHDSSGEHAGIDQMHHRRRLRVSGGTAKPNSKTVPTRVKAIKKRIQGSGQGKQLARRTATPFLVAFDPLCKPSFHHGPVYRHQLEERGNDGVTTCREGVLVDLTSIN